jgi:hypothetical protein
MALWSLWRLRQWWRNPDRRPQHLLRIAAAILIPALLDLGIIYLIFVFLPDYTESPLQTVMVFAPDLAIEIYIMLALAAGWGLVRTLLYIWLLVLHGGTGNKMAPSPA